MFERGEGGFRDSNGDRFDRGQWRVFIIFGAAGVLGIGGNAALTFLGSDSDPDQYIRGALSPHSQNDSIPEGKVFPPEANVSFRDDAASYTAPPKVTDETGLVEVLAFCGNQIDKRDPYNLYTVMTVRKDGQDQEVHAGIPDAPACADGVLNMADRDQL